MPPVNGATRHDVRSGEADTQVAYVETPTRRFRISRCEVRKAIGDRSSLILEIGFEGGGYAAIRMSKARMRDVRNLVSEALDEWES
jgi:hypothetical protein